MDIRDLSIGDWVCAEQLCGVHNEPRLTPPMKVVGVGDGAGGWVNLMIDPEQGDPFEFEPHEIRVRYYGLNVPRVYYHLVAGVGMDVEVAEDNLFPTKEELLKSL